MEHRCALLIDEEMFSNLKRKKAARFAMTYMNNHWQFTIDNVFTSNNSYKVCPFCSMILHPLENQVEIT
jgi:hypothetical protein